MGEKIMERATNLIGNRYGKLEVIGRAENRVYKGKKYAQWLCKCDCGNTVIVLTHSLKCGDTKSCGCITRKHGMTNTKLYKTWKNMRGRCNQKGRCDFKYYGERGISICEEWGNFNRFYEWAMENGYEEHLTIDRIDVNGNYEPSNCRWISKQEQANNKRNNRHLEYNGQNKTISEWSREVGISATRIIRRLNAGWSAEDALRIKPRAGRNQFSTDGKGVSRWQTKDSAS